MPIQPITGHRLAVWSKRGDLSAARAMKSRVWIGIIFISLTFELEIDRKASGPS